MIPRPDIDASRSEARPRRVDARRNVVALIEAARAVFAASGVDAPAKEITDRAGLGVGTLYRHFPRRTELILAVLQRELEDCMGAFERLHGAASTEEAMTGWVAPFTSLVTAKHGLAVALHSGDPAYERLPELLLDRLAPPLQAVFDRAAAEGVARRDATAREALTAVALVCQPVPGLPPGYGSAMADVFARGLLAHRR